MDNDNSKEQPAVTMVDGDPPTVQKAVKAADKRRLDNNETEHPLPVTQDHTRNFNSVYPVEGTRQIAGHRTNTVSEYQTSRFLAGELHAFKLVSLPSYAERRALLTRARRSKSVSARIEAIVSWGGDSNTSLAIQPIDDILPSPRMLEDVWPSVYDMPDQQARRMALRSVDTLEQQGAPIDTKEPATEESNAVMDSLFDFDAFERDQEARAVEDAEEDDGAQG